MAASEPVINSDDEETQTQQELPGDTLVIFDNPEKRARKRLGPEDYMPYATSRILLSAMPGSGKRNLIFNILHRISPPPRVIHLVHHDPECTEYDHVSEMGIPLLIYTPDNFPTLANIDDPFGDDLEAESERENSSDEEKNEKNEKNPPHSVIIIDEVTNGGLNKISAHRFERLVNHACTHRNATLICSAQSLMEIPAKVRRGFNNFALWKQADEQLNKMVARRCSIKPQTLEDMFELCRDKYDFIYIDLDAPHDSEMRYRLNFISPIIINKG